MGDDSLPILDCSLSCANHVYKLFRAIEKLGKTALVTIFQEGIKLSVKHESNACEAHVFLNRELFTRYSYNERRNEPHHANGSDEDEEEDPGVTFEISLKALTRCMQIIVSPKNERAAMITADNTNKSRRARNRDEAAYGDRYDRDVQDNHGRDQEDDTYLETNVEAANPVTCSFLYEGEGTPFVLYFAEGEHANTSCMFKTQVAEWDSTHIPLNLEAIVFKAIIQGSALDDALREFESIDCREIVVTGRSIAPRFILSGENATAFTLDYTFCDDPQILNAFYVSGVNGPSSTASAVSVSNGYSYQHVSRAADAIRLATSVSIRCDDDGVMSIQSKCETPTGQQSYIDFRFQSKIVE